MDIMAYSKYLRYSPRKLRLVAKAIKDMSLKDILAKLPLIEKKAGLPILKVIKSAVANAKNNNNIQEDNLKIKSLVVEEGMRMKRMDKSHGARFGRGLVIKQLSHVKVILTEKTNN